MSDTQKISHEDLDLIRSLNDRDLTTLIERINDGGWGDGRTKLMRFMRTRKYSLVPKEIANGKQPDDQS